MRESRALRPSNTQTGDQQVDRTSQILCYRVLKLTGIVWLVDAPALGLNTALRRAENPPLLTRSALPAAVVRNCTDILPALVALTLSGLISATVDLTPAGG